MRNTRYLNAILTVLALLLAAQLWTTWAQVGFPAGTPAQAASPPPAGIPDTGAQQQQMIDLLKQLVQKTDEQTALWRSGEVRVRVAKDDKAK